MEQGEGPPQSQKWFAMTVYTAHADKPNQKHINYIYAKDEESAFKWSFSMPGWKKRQPYEMRSLTQEEAEILEEIIEELPNMTLEKAQRGGVYGRRRDLGIDVSKMLEERLEEKRKKE
jgi:hypothetical protein